YDLSLHRRLPPSPTRRSSDLLALTACGKSETPSAPPAAPEATVPAPAPAPAPVAENTVGKSVFGKACALCHAAGVAGAPKPGDKDRKSTRLNSSHVKISYAVF